MAGLFFRALAGACYMARRGRVLWRPLVPLGGDCPPPGARPRARLQESVIQHHPTWHPHPSRGRMDSKSPPRSGDGGRCIACGYLPHTRNNKTTEAFVFGNPRARTWTRKTSISRDGVGMVGDVLIDLTKQVRCNILGNTRRRNDSGTTADRRRNDGGTTADRRRIGGARGGVRRPWSSVRYL